MAQPGGSFCYCALPALQLSVNLIAAFWAIVCQSRVYPANHRPATWHLEQAEWDFLYLHISCLPFD